MAGIGTINVDVSVRVEGDLLDILTEGAYERLRPGDYASLVALRDHFSRRLEQADAAVKRCPVLDSLAADPLDGDDGPADDVSDLG